MFSPFWTHRLQNIHTLLSMKVWKNTETTPHRLVRDTLTTFIREDVRGWINERFSQFPKIGENVVSSLFVLWNYKSPQFCLMPVLNTAAEDDNTEIDVQSHTWGIFI